MSALPNVDPTTNAPAMPVDGLAQDELAVPVEIRNIGSDLLKKLQQPEMTTRRIEVRDVHERREFWNGNHWIFWSEVWQTWRTPDLGVSTSPGGESDQDQPYGHYVNDYLYYGLDAIALLASGHSPTKLYPKDAKNPDDVTAADAGTSYIKYFRRKNRDEMLRVKQAYFLYNDGAFYNYVRPVADEDEYGTSTVPTLESQMTSLGQLPVQTGEQTYPNVEIILDTYGKLEVRRNASAEKLKELPYLDLSVEVPRSAMRAMYPKVAEKIGMSASGAGDDSTYEVNARRRVGQGTGSLSMGAIDQFVTYKRAWVQPWSYYELDETQRQQLQQFFPDGYLIVKADDVVCDMRPERLLDRWKMAIGLPSTGGNGPSVGSSQISIQKVCNDLLNLHVDSSMQNVPTAIVDREVLNLAALGSSSIQPGSYIPGIRPQGMAMDAGVAIIPPTTLGEGSVQLYQYLSQYASQRATGVTPAMWGGQMGGAGATSSGYQFMSAQSRKRLSLPWGAMKFCNEETDLLAFKLFRETASPDLSYIELGEGGQTVTKEIHVDDLSGEVQVIHDTSDEIPSTPTEERDLLMQLLPMAVPGSTVAAVFSNPSSQPFLKSRLGLKEIVFPTELARQHQRVEIRQLLDQKPQMMPGPDGQPVPVGPSILPNPIMGLEDHESHAAEIRDWWESPDGRRAADNNSPGTANVILHYEAHMALMAQIAQASAMTQGPPVAAAPPGRPGPPAHEKPEPPKPRIAAAPPPNIVPFQPAAAAPGMPGGQ